MQIVITDAMIRAAIAAYERERLFSSRVTGSTSALGMEAAIRAAVAPLEARLARVVSAWHQRAAECREDDATRDPLDMAYAAAADTLDMCAQDLVSVAWLSEDT